MTNFEIYRKTLPFTWLRILFSFLGVVVALGLPVAAFLITQSSENACTIVTSIAGIVGLVLLWLLTRYLGYMLKAGQIAMITEGVTTGEVPEHVVEAGKEAVKKRFITANVYFALDSAIRGITNQLTRGITGASGALGGLMGGEQGSQVGSGIGSAISAVVAVVLEYVNYCCLGWVFRNKDQNAFKSTCDGAVVYFQNWKTLLKNAGKIVGITLLSLVIIGVPLAYLTSRVLGASSAVMQLVSAIAVEAETEASVVLWIGSGTVGLILWAFLNSALIKPYLLVSVLRAYMAAAEQNPPKVDIYGKLCGLSSRFRKTMEKADVDEPVVDAHLA